ncbi:hypothetical protein DFH08DRAFT_823129 [Mycena albidolilacea]|uniref:Uncharacterized protein n=1 Tax=Mycena albidolilacea TaxID=1033008 RepID=A0AAD6Z6J3_9AGAR|nr:hypothetical protein DFH08DRAFT_823129 [Mycena albidolilacea]
MILPSSELAVSTRISPTPAGWDVVKAMSPPGATTSSPCCLVLERFGTKWYQYWSNVMGGTTRETMRFTYMTAQQGGTDSMRDTDVDQVKMDTQMISYHCIRLPRLSYEKVNKCGTGVGDSGSSRTSTKEEEQLFSSPPLKSRGKMGYKDDSVRRLHTRVLDSDGWSVRERVMSYVTGSSDQLESLFCSATVLVSAAFVHSYVTTCLPPIKHPCPSSCRKLRCQGGIEPNFCVTKPDSLMADPVLEAAKLLVAHHTMPLNCSFPFAVVFLKVQWDGSLHCKQPVYITYKGHNDIFATMVIVNEINWQKINV